MILFFLCRVVVVVVENLHIHRMMSLMMMKTMFLEKEEAGEEDVGEGRTNSFLTHWDQGSDCDLIDLSRFFFPAFVDCSL